MENKYIDAYYDTDLGSIDVLLNDDVQFSIGCKNT